MLDILSFFPAGETPSPEQETFLLAYARLPDNVQVVVLNVPVAGGKTFLLHTIAAYEAAKHDGGASLIAPSTHLVGQLFDDVGHLGWARAPYRYAERKISWEAERKRFADTPLKMGNFYSYLALKAYSRCLCVDEAHTIKGMLQDMEGVRLWYHLTPWPLDIQTIDQFLYWLLTDPEAAEHKKLAKLIGRDPTSFVLEQERAEYRGTEQLCLRVVPLTPKNNRPVMWPPSKVKRIVLASATLSKEDLVDIGLDKRYVAWLSSASRIPVDRRPCVYEPRASPTYGRPEEVEKLAEALKDLASYHAGERGLVHVTYALSAQLRPLLSKDSRFIFHAQGSKVKAAAFRKWQATPDGVLIACGMHEGVNLKYDAARWQAIGKICWPSLADAAVAAKSEQRPEWYLWEALKIVMQAYGRVCRMPDDYGVTYILTHEFKRLYEECVAAGLIPLWFSEAVQL